MLVQKIHQQAHFALLDELTADLPRLFRRDAANLRQPLRLVHQDVERVLAERVRDAHREPLAHPAYQTRPQILRDAPDGRGQTALECLGRKLLAIGRVRDPEAGQNDLLTRPDIRECAGRGHLGPVLAREPQHGVAVLLIVENDLLDRAADHNICLFVPP